MVHGAGGGGWEWRLWAEVFVAAGWAVDAPDLQPAAAGLAATRFDHFRAQVVDRCCGHPSPCVLVGASLGGLLALAAAAEARASALVLLNPMPPSGIEPAPALRERPAVVRWSASAFADTRSALPDADPATARWAHARWRDESGTAINEALAGIAVDPPSCPVLVMAAGEDRDIPPATSRALANHLRADVLTIAGASHLGILFGRRATAAAALALAWLNLHSQPGNGV